MGEVRRITAEIDGDTAAAIDSAVASGDYAAEADILAHAIALWQRSRESNMTELRQLIEQGLEGPFVDGNFDAEDIKRRGREQMGLVR